MTPAREDPELVLPEPPPEVPLLGPVGAGLTLARPAPLGRWIVRSERVTIRGAAADLAGVEIDGEEVLRALRSDAGTVANALLAPGLVDLERVGPRGPARQAVLATSTLPLAAVQWRSDPGGALPGAVQLTLSTPDEGRYRASPDGVVWSVDGDTIGAVVVVPRPLALELDAGPAGELLVTLRPAPGPAVTLLVTRGTPAVAARAVAAASHLPAHARIASRGVGEEGLHLESGVEEIDDGFAWARERLRTALRADRSPRATLWSGLAALAVGDREAADVALRRSRTGEPSHAALLAAGLAMTFGDPGPATSAAAERVGTDERTADGDGPWRALALRQLAEVLHDLGPPDLREALLREAERSAAPSGGAGSGRKLPVVGAAPARPTLPGWLPSLLRGDPSSPAPDGTELGDPEGPALAALLRTESDEGWSGWRGLLAAGLRDGPDGPGSWDTHGAPGPVAPSASSLLIALSHGLLGLSPDAPTGRIRIAPRLPSHLTRFRARGLTVGAASIRLEYERADGRERYLLEPSAGAVPATAILDLRAAGPVDSIRIDGAPAELETRIEGDRTIFGVQLPVDAPRTVEILTD